MQKEVGLRREDREHMASEPRGLREAASHLRFFAEHNDVDGLIGAAAEVAACAKSVLGPETILSSRLTDALLSMLDQMRPEAVQASACSAITAIARFDEIQLEIVAQGGTVPFVQILLNGQPETQLEACRACEAIAQHRDGREALAQAGAVRALLV